MQDAPQPLLQPAKPATASRNVNRVYALTASRWRAAPLVHLSAPGYRMAFLIMGCGVLVATCAWLPIASVR